MAAKVVSAEVAFDGKTVVMHVNLPREYPQLKWVGSGKPRKKRTLKVQEFVFALDVEKAVKDKGWKAATGKHGMTKVMDGALVVKAVGVEGTEWVDEEPGGAV